jgi:hypothetical protein
MSSFCPSVLMALGAHSVHKKHLECAEREHKVHRKDVVSKQSLSCAHRAHCAHLIQGLCRLSATAQADRVA